MHHNIETSYVLGEYHLDIPEKKTQEFVNEFYKITDESGKQEGMNYSWVLQTPKMSSLKVWEQTSVFNELLDTFITYASYYSTETQHVNIGDCWAVLYEKGNYSLEHAHLGSPTLLSFVFYVQNEKASPIEFVDGNKIVYPKTNTLLIFPPWVKHKVPPLQDEKPRMVLAGNFMAAQ
jgi:hypothetical protein